MDIIIQASASLFWDALAPMGIVGIILGLGYLALAPLVRS